MFIDSIDNELYSLINEYIFIYMKLLFTYMHTM
jgi:hypothetical protein